MKPLLSVSIFLLLLLSGLVTGVRSYKTTQALLVDDLNQALEQTLSKQQQPYLTPDTLRTYLSCLKTEPLRGSALLCYALDDAPSEGLCSKALPLGNERKSVAVRAYINASAATILSLSDQRFTLFWWVLSLLWGAFCLRRRAQGYAFIGVNTPLPVLATLRLTPMQRQLLELIMAQPTQTVDKQTVCQALWPKKDNPNDTLYTLVKRLRQTLEQQSDYTIVNEGEGRYRLKEKQL